MATSIIQRPSHLFLAYKQLVSTDDLNTVYDLGFYRWTSDSRPENCPGVGAGRMIIFGAETVNAGHKAAIVVDADGNMYSRLGANAGWNSFKPYINVEARLTALEAECMPHILTQPASQSVAAGTSVSFTVEARNADAYEWQYLKPDSADWTTTSTGFSATYTLTTQARHNGYRYRCKVSNGLGDVYSDVVTLTVT